MNPLVLHYVSEFLPFNFVDMCLLGMFCYVQLLNKPLGDAKRLELHIVEDQQ